jgi:FkbM family methyltransferase
MNCGLQSNTIFSQVAGTYAIQRKFQATMNIGGSVKGVFSRLGYTFKRFEFPADNPIDVLGALVELRLRPGFFVLQIGANDGKFDDPAWETIRKHRLKALLVEPMPGMFEKLIENYSDQPQVTCENCAIAREDGEVTLYHVPPHPSLPPYVTRVASFSRQVILKQRGKVPTIDKFIEQISVPALSLRTLLQKHGISKVDWLQLDTEGFDFEILKMLWATPIRPEIISFECEHLNRSDKIGCAKMLRKAGYNYISLGRDAIAIQPR